MFKYIRAVAWRELKINACVCMCSFLLFLLLLVYFLLLFSFIFQVIINYCSFSEEWEIHFSQPKDFFFLFPEVWFLFLFHYLYFFPSAFLKPYNKFVSHYKTYTKIIIVCVIFIRQVQTSPIPSCNLLPYPDKLMMKFSRISSNFNNKKKISFPLRSSQEMHVRVNYS